MKLSFKTILPILLIFTLLILLAGCTTPSEEQPGYTPGTITGIIAAPCCSTSAEPVSELCCVSPEYWCIYCQKTWNLQDGIEVVLTYGEDEVATVFTNKDGEFTFTNVDPGKNYVVTAYCPGFADNRPLVKDVALELIEGGSFDTKITDLVSTSLGLVVDFLVYYTDWGPEDISLDAVLADRPNFPNFSKFYALILQVRRVVENCEVNLLTDDDVLYATCRAAEEISGLTIGCGAGLTSIEPPPGPPTGKFNLYLKADPWEGAKSLTGAGVYNDGTLDVAVSTEANSCYNFLYWTVDLGNSSWVTGNLGTKPLEVDMYGNVTLTAHFACPAVDPNLVIDIGEISEARTLNASGLRTTAPDASICYPNCAKINSVTVNCVCEDVGSPFPLELTPSYVHVPLVLTFDYDTENISFDYETGKVCFIGGLLDLPHTYTIDVTYTNPCGVVAATGTVYVEFKNCDTKYTVTYDANGGTGSQTDPSSPYYAGVTVTVLGQGTIARTNYTFIRWNTEAGGGGTAYDPADTFSMPAADVILYAQWTKQPCVYLSYNNGTRCHDWIYVNIEDAKNLNKAVITLEQTNSSHVQPEQYSVGTLMSPGVCTHNTSVAVSTRTINITVTRNNSVEVDGDGNIVGVYFSADSSSITSTVTIVGSTLYDKGNNVINHTVGTPSSLGLPGPGGWN